jgi:hypothetical protein
MEGGEAEKTLELEEFGKGEKKEGGNGIAVQGALTVTQTTRGLLKVETQEPVERLMNEKEEIDIQK